MNEHLHVRPRRTPTLSEPPAMKPTPYYDICSGKGLSVDTIEDFVRWAAAVPIGYVDQIRQRISHCRGNHEIVDRLLHELWNLPVMDVGRHRIILSILGELRDERAVSKLEEFIWFQGELTPVQHGEKAPCTFETSGTEILQARAAEMLSYIATTTAANATLKIARSHPKLVVRAAAIDAHMFNHDDSHKAAEQLREAVRATDHVFIGMPRKVHGGDPEQFERAVLEWYDRHPEQRPRLPAQRSAPSPQPRAWFRKSASRQERDQKGEA